MSASSILDNPYLDNNGEFMPLVRKYAVLLSIFLFVEIALNMTSPFLMNMLQSRAELTIQTTALYQVAFVVPSYLMNLVTAILLYFDMKKTGAKSIVILILAVFYNDMGVVFFLVTLLYKKLVFERSL
jgi:hypothetical protein